MATTITLNEYDYERFWQRFVGYDRCQHTASTHCSMITEGALSPLVVATVVVGHWLEEVVMMDAITPIAETYARLALAIEQHIPGYVDAYYGLALWRAEAETSGKRPPAELAAAVRELVEAVDAATMDEQRKDYLQRQVRAMRVSVGILNGDRLSLAEEVEALYDVTPRWVDEATFEDAHRTLDALLPAGASLVERMAERRKRVEVPVERLQGIIGDVFAELRRRTNARFALPDDEDVVLEWVRDQPWSAYNWYRGDRRSLIEINTDLPLQITRLVELLAHEAYPGHHTEHALKEMRLVRAEGRIEHAVALINSPSCVVAEGIAMLAPSIILSDAEWVRWHADELFVRAGCEHLDAEREHAINHALGAFSGVRGNAAFLLHDQGCAPDDVAAYLERWALSTPEEAQRGVAFISSPIYRSYTFTYSEGATLLETLFAARGDRDHWFGRLLTEAVTPTQIRQWTAAND
jgi:hypothetical protein